MYYVYIIESIPTGIFYKGFSTNYKKRLQAHNNGESHYTSINRPWKLIYVEKLSDKTAALKRERQLKHSNKKYLKWLVSQDSNILLSDDESL